MATSNVPDDVRLKVNRGSDTTINATGAFVSTGFTFTFAVHHKTSHALQFAKTVGSGITHSQDTPSTILAIVVAEADTAGLSEAPDTYRWSVWRTNSGSKVRLAGGPLVVAPTPEVADV